MINLMPNDEKKEIRSARTNVILGRYILVILFAFGFLALLLGGSYVVLTQTKESAQRLIDASSHKVSAQSTATTNAAAQTNTLSQAKSVLNQAISYSNALANIAQQMPEGTVLKNLSLTSGTLQGTPLTLKVYAKTAADSAALKQKFQSSPIFTAVSFGSDGNSNDVEGYPISLSATLTITKAAYQ